MMQALGGVVVPIIRAAAAGQPPEHMQQLFTVCVLCGWVGVGGCVCLSLV